MMLWTVVLRGQVLCSSYQKIYGAGASTLSNLTNILLSARRANVRQAVCMELETELISRQGWMCHGRETS